MKGRVDLRKLEPIKSLKVMISRNDRGDDILDVQYGWAHFGVVAARIEVIDLRPHQAGPGPQRPAPAQPASGAETERSQ